MVQPQRARCPSHLPPWSGKPAANAQRLAQLRRLVYWAFSFNAISILLAHSKNTFSISISFAASDG